MRRYFRTELLDDAATGDAHADRWVLSYADFITLLFAFFVVMYSISSVNDGKFRVLSASLVDVFNDPRVSAALEARSRASVTAFDRRAKPTADIEDRAIETALLRADELGAVLTAHLAEAIASGAVDVRESADWTEVELGAAFAFDAQTQRLAKPAAALLETLAVVAQAVDVPVRVEGFTDNVPPTTAAQTSQWERSAAQAAAVAARLVEAGVDARRLSATGFGDLHPVASNASDAGRAANRRVVVAIARHDRVPDAAASMAATTEREALPAQTLQRTTELPGPEAITL